VLPLDSEVPLLVLPLLLLLPLLVLLLLPLGLLVLLSSGFSLDERFSLVLILWISVTDLVLRDLPTL
jgi:hypothetical protein